MNTRSGHAVHFLERLERASGDAADLALRMYHDPQLLRSVLANVRIPAQYDRIAVSLHEEDNGPFIVSDRAGRFITCLAKGMGVKDLHLLPNSQLLAHIRKMEVARDRFALAESLVGTDKPAAALMKRILKQAEDVTREEILALSAIQPAIKPLLFFWVVNSAISATKLNIEVLRRKKPGTRNRKLLREYWENHWAAGHFALLSGMTGAQGCEEQSKNHLRQFLNCMIVRLFSGDFALIVRLLWFIGKMGTLLLPECKRMMLKPSAASDWIVGFYGAVVIGLRHRKTRSQVQDAVIKSFKSVENLPPWVAQLMIGQKESPDALLVFALTALRDPDRIHQRFLEISKRNAIAYSAAQKEPLPAPYDWQTPEDVPEDLAVVLHARATYNILNNPVLLSILAQMPPWLARCEAEDFYFPGEFYEHVRRPWQPKYALEILEEDWRYYGAKQPVTVGQKPGRNDPCPCGSGKKYKRCCFTEGEKRDTEVAGTYRK
jgi:hypothetical protein